MKILCTGKNGYVGRHVVAEILRQGHEINDKEYDAVIDLAWHGLPNYSSVRHYENVCQSIDRLKWIVKEGVTNVTVAGTCLESVDKPPHYAKAKLAVLEEVEKLPCCLKWVRLFHIWGGDGERPERLVPQLMRAIEAKEPKFSVIDGERDFMRVTTAARYLVKAALQTEVTGIIDCCTGASLEVATFCERLKHTSPIEIVRDYPMPDYEPRVIVGNPTKLRSLP